MITDGFNFINLSLFDSALAGAVGLKITSLLFYHSPVQNPIYGPNGVKMIFISTVGMSALATAFEAAWRHFGFKKAVSAIKPITLSND